MHSHGERCRSCCLDPGFPATREKEIRGLPIAERQASIWLPQPLQRFLGYCAAAVNPTVDG